ncbi:DUF5819 family protein [Streptomyces sp. NPDC048416]|uniref:DUF5819 family protein n=1 Tax=Streptomyces sp. NPDC048416 TaxID=3365546 RepID=UPI0037234735
MDSYRDGTGAGGKADGAESEQVRAVEDGSGNRVTCDCGASRAPGPVPETGQASGAGEGAGFGSAVAHDGHTPHPPVDGRRPADGPERAGGPERVDGPEPADGSEPADDLHPAHNLHPADVLQSADGLGSANRPATADGPGHPADGQGLVPPQALAGAGGAAGPSRGADADGGAGSGLGIAGLPVRFQFVAALGLAAIAVVACFQIGMVFLHVAPSNTISKQYGKVVDDWIYPEFEQNWKLFAPNPLQQNIDVQARAEIKLPDGSTRTTDWIDFSAQDGAGIRHNPLPSHTEQNELRRSWDFFVGSHTDDNKPSGLRGELSEQYLRRIVMLRLGTHRDGGTVDRIQVRSMTTSVKSPPWSDEKTDTRPTYRVVPWWTVTPADLPKGAGDAGTEAKR